MLNTNNETQPSPRDMPYFITNLREMNRNGIYIAMVTAARIP
jgi:hypothetical protein